MFRDQRNLFELLGTLHQGTGPNLGRNQSLLIDRRTADVTGSHLNVLSGDGIDNIRGLQVVFKELIGIDPNAHSIGSPEALNIADTLYAGNRLFDVVNEKVSEIVPS